MDRNGKVIFMDQNEKGYWVNYIEDVPLQFKKMLILKEDRFFNYHFGFNPISTAEAALGYMGISDRKASSTITQQLVKILLENEFERTIKNKAVETLYALSLEIFQSKEKILEMYANSVYFGNQVQGVAEASAFYFNLAPELLTKEQSLQLLATLSNPASNNPSKEKNKKIALTLSKRTFAEKIEESTFLETAEIKTEMGKRERKTNVYFEIKDMVQNDSAVTKLTIDGQLTERIRNISEEAVENLKFKNVNQAAVVVIKLPENELLSLIGSPNPQSTTEGSKINMLLQPRPIGSTIKPFIYLKAFEKGLRPYTLVNDREYKYSTGIGFPFYPKNFDYKYHGTVSLHYALSNSLNTPAIKVLEYINLNTFFDFLEKNLGFKPTQSLSNYQLGIALGSLEMNILDLSHYFTIFPNQGVLKKLKIKHDEDDSELGEQLVGPEYVQLINRILNDRRTGIDQFGLKSGLNLFQKNYCLKTGTSYDFKDSWIIGYTPDFLVAVWVGNADNTSMDEITGQMGAGLIWAQIMEVLFNSPYNKKTAFNFDAVKEFYGSDNIEYGLESDVYEEMRQLLIKDDNVLILRPHNGDIFLFEKASQIILEAKEEVNWHIDGQFKEQNKKCLFTPSFPGQYQITAQSFTGHEETITITVE